MSFELFGFEYFSGSGFGLWIASIETRNRLRSLFCIYNNRGHWQLTLCYMRIILRKGKEDERNKN
jgi:hypothetical protein